VELARQEDKLFKTADNL